VIALLFPEQTIAGVFFAGRASLRLIDCGLNHRTEATHMRRLEFWYDFGSTYSYLSAMRIEQLAAAADVEIVHRPFLLGPIFKAQGWDTSPFQLYPDKGRYMRRDMERIAAERGIAFHFPSTFPVNSLHAARMALVGEADGWIGRFGHAVFKAQFAERRDIADRAVLAEIASGLGIDSGWLLERSNAPEIKAALRQQTEKAAALRIFGAPTFVTSGGELFWGDDRLEQAIAWSSR
jgi:2-hydroxychromene-2-carboxylate isomerase